MNTEDWIECAPLKPARKDIMVFRIYILGASRPEETTDICCPVRHTCQIIIQSGHNLPFKCIPVPTYVSGPVDGSKSLLTRKSGTGQNSYTLIWIGCTLSFINRFTNKQRIGEPVKIPQSKPGLLANKCIILRFGCIHPPGVYSQAKQIPVQSIPMGFLR